LTQRPETLGKVSKSVLEKVILSSFLNLSCTPKMISREDQGGLSQKCTPLENHNEAIIFREMSQS